MTKSLSRWLVVLLTLSLALSGSTSADDSAPVMEAFRAAQEPLRDRRYEEAARGLAAFRRAHAASALALEAWVLEAGALLRADKPREALAATSDFLRANGESAWAGRMRYTAADAYVALGDPAQAAATLRERVQATTSTKARAEIARRHLALGDTDFDGVAGVDDLGRKTLTRNPVRALEEYQRALAVGLDTADATRAHERMARLLEELGRMPEAAAAWNELLEARGLKQLPARGEPLPAAWREAALLLLGRGRARLRAADREAARADLQVAAEALPAGAQQLEALLLLAEERLARAEQAKDDSAFEEGVGTLRRAVTEYRALDAAVRAQELLAQAYARHGQPEKAAVEWRALAERFPKSDTAPLARYQAGQALRQAGRFDEAAIEWNAFLAAWPDHRLWAEARGALVEAAFAKGIALREAGELDAAARAWQAFAEAYPEDARASIALLRAAEALRELKNYDAAMAVARALAGRYVQSAAAPAALLLAALIEEDDLGRLEAALASYTALLKSFGASPAAAQARLRMERLKAKHLEVRCERVIGSDQKPVLSVTTRNIQALNVRVYRLGLEEYFQRKGSLQGVEDLQLEIVKPDRTARWDFASYEPFQLLQAEREVPIEGRGAYVVVAGDEDLTATTLLLISDLEFVVKRSEGRQLLVWAFDRTTQESVAGARVIASGQGEVGKTGADGVWQGSGGSSAQHVMVVSEKGDASTEIAAGTAVAAGFSSKAYVYTDRPVYRPGSPVQWRAVFLEAQGGGYQSPKEREGRITIYDSRGQSLRTETVKSSALGTFSGSFGVDAAAPLGSWRIQLEVPNLGAWNGQFEVQEFRKPEFTVEIAPVKSSYRTGERVEATLKLTYGFGGPVANAPVNYEVWRMAHTFVPPPAQDYAWYVREGNDDPSQRTSTQGQQRVSEGQVTTDAEGRASISFLTQRLDEDAQYLVRAAARDVTRRWIVDENRIPVMRADHLAVVRAERQVIRPRQELSVEILTLDARERPVARSGELWVAALRNAAIPQEKVRGGGAVVAMAEEVVEQRHPLSTRADGRAELRITIEKPGRYRLRWRKSDEEGHLVTAYTDVEVSGPAEDATRDARLVSARTLYSEGETAELLLSTPTGRGRALLTYEGEQVLDYRLLDLKSTSTVLELPLEGRHAPNVFFAVAVPGKERLLEASTQVVVLRHLDVQVAVEPAVAAPGDEVTISVTTRDAQGKPVSAELGVGLVDEAVYSVVRELAPEMRPYFYDRRRPHGVVTASSLGTRFYGLTRETSKDLLADAEARTGGAARVAAASALRIARDALRQGDVSTAVDQVLLATQSDPDSWDARALLAELSARQDVQEQLAERLQAHFKSVEADMPAEKAPMDSLRSMREEKGAAPRPSRSPAAPGSAGADSEDADFAKDKAEESEMGIGGGAGGSFGGRSGGGRAQSKGLPAKAGPSSGELSATLGSLDRAALNKKLGRQLEALGFEGLGAFEVRKHFADTALFEPRVMTDDKGQARVKVKLPDNLTTWRATARGVSRSALVGEGRGRAVSRRDLLLRVDPPRFLVQSDEITVPSVVHNLGSAVVTVPLRVSATGLALSGADENLRIAPGGHAVSDRRMAAPDAGTATIEARVGDGLLGDALQVGFGVLARGIHQSDGRTGRVDTTLADQQETFVDVPEGAIPGTVSLTILLEPSLETSLLDALLFLDLFPYACVEQTVHRFLPAAEARVALAAAGSPAADRLKLMDEAIARGAERLRHLQSDDGSFGWFGGGRGDLAMTAYALRGLVAARTAGIGELDTPIERAIAALSRMLKGGSQDASALAHWALAEAGRMDGEAYASTFRRRNEELSALGLAWLALAAQRLGRSFDVDEIVRLLLERRTEEGAFTFWKGRPEDCFSGSDREATAMVVAALVSGRSIPVHAERAMAWLRQQGAPRRGVTTKDRAAFISAASAWIRAGRSQGFGGEVEILLDGKSVRTVKVGAGPLEPEDRRFQVPAATALAAGRHAVAFRLKGQGALSWTVHLESVVTSKDLPGEEHGLLVERLWLEPHTAVAPGQPAPPKPGYEILREAARPKVEPRELSTVASADKVLVRLSLVAPRDLDYVLLEDPLPAGCEVLDDTARGPFDWQERRDTRQVFFLSKVPKGRHVIEYVLQATHLGSFTALGARAYAMYAPEVRGRTAGRHLRVVDDAPGGDTSGETLQTPDEVYARALRLYAEKAYADARPLLESLKREQPLRDEILVDIEAYLLGAAVALKDAKGIVAAREELLRRDGSRIPQDLDTQRAIAFAYGDLGEHEVAAGLYRDLVVRGFSLEMDWAQTLTARGLEIEALDELGAELAAWPLANVTAGAALARSQRYAELRRPNARGALPAGEPMDAESLEALAQITAHYSHLPVAAPAQYVLVGTLARRGMAESAAREAEAFLRRYPDSHYLDDARWFLSDARFQRFEAAPDEALASSVREAAKPLTKDNYPQPRGGLAPSSFRPRAWHLLARVEHVLGNLDQAISLYRRADELEDAREALAFLTEEHLALEPVVRTPAGAATSIPVRYRNVQELTLKYYPIDLQVLFAVRKTLEDLHRVDLSGIMPARQWKAPLPDAKDHQAHLAQVPVPLEGTAPGVWLVVAKAGSHEGSTLVVRSDLSVALQPLGGKLRVYVTDGKGAPVRGAYATISNGVRIIARGLTDGRGVFDAPGADANAYVVVSKDDRYALGGGPASRR